MCEQGVFTKSCPVVPSLANLAFKVLPDSLQSELCVDGLLSAKFEAAPLPSWKRAERRMIVAAPVGISENVEN